MWNKIKSWKFSFILIFIFLLTQALSVQSQIIIGNNADGILIDLPGGSMNAIRYQCAQDMTVSKMYAKIATSGSGKIKCAIYSDNNGNPDTFLMGTKELTNPGTGWKSFDLTSGLALTAGIWYHLVLWTNNTGYAINYTVNGVGTPYRSLIFGTWPNSFGTTKPWAGGTYCLYTDTVTIRNPDVLPVAVNDTIKVSNKAIAFIDPLLNDYDRNGDELHIVSWTNPSHGTLDTVLGGNKFHYKPAQNYLGLDGSEPWALPPYNRSPYAWGRAIGWVVMGLTEILDIIPEDFPQRDSIVQQYKTVLKSLAKYQDPTTGLWYQVVDHQDDPGNWQETSCSIMFVYSMSRAIQKGFLDESYSKNVELGYMGVLTKISEDKSNMVYLTDICEGTGVSSDIQYYFDRAKSTNDDHGLGSFLIMNELLGYNNMPWLSTKVEEIQARNISIYPNPCNDYAELNTSGLDQNAKIDVYNISGMKIKTIQTSGHSGTVLLDMSVLPRGIYLIRTHSNGQVYTEKLIRQ